MNAPVRHPQLWYAILDQGRSKKAADHLATWKEYLPEFSFDILQLLSTFRYGSSHWTTNSVYNHVYALKEGLDGDQEAKFPAFNTLPFTKVCAGMRLGSEKNFITLHKPSSSLLTCFSGSYVSTFHLRQSWLNILKGSTLQAYCNVQGINVIQGTVDSRVRIGILGNNENDCVTPDSGLGIGLGGAHLRGTGVSTGATMNSQQAFGYILIH
eukprot:gene15213-6416_t